MNRERELALVFGNEWADLLPENRARVSADFVLAMMEDGCSEKEYRARIGKGNLGAYVASLRAGEARRV